MDSALVSLKHSKISVGSTSLKTSTFNNWDYFKLCLMLINVGGFLAFNLFCGTGIQNFRTARNKARSS